MSHVPMSPAPAWGGGGGAYLSGLYGLRAKLMTSADQRQPVVVEIVIATLDLDSRHMRSEQTPAEATQSYILYCRSTSSLPAVLVEE
jgi:hypothetical protein